MRGWRVGHLLGLGCRPGRLPFSAGVGKHALRVPLPTAVAVADLLGGALMVVSGLAKLAVERLRASRDKG